MLIQIFISTYTIVACFLNVLKMYESDAQSLKQINNDLKENAQKDPLTKLWNREYMNQLLDKFITQQNNFSVIMFDLDHFKKINDNYGHPVGDKVLKKFVQLLSRAIPKNASAIRYGGEEFLVVLPNKNGKEAFEIADKIRNKVQIELKIKEIKKKITVSGGVKEYSKDLDKLTLIEEADKNLYMAKQNGRNKIVA